MNCLYFLSFPLLGPRGRRKEGEKCRESLGRETEASARWPLPTGALATLLAITFPLPLTVIPPSPTLSNLGRYATRKEEGRSSLAHINKHSLSSLPRPPS